MEYIPTEFRDFDAIHSFFSTYKRSPQALRNRGSAVRTFIPVDA